MCCRTQIEACHDINGMLKSCNLKRKQYRLNGQVLGRAYEATLCYLGILYTGS